MPNKKIVLEDYRSWKDPRKAFKVIKLVGSIEYQIGNYLTEIIVQDLCNMPNTWLVTIIKAAE